MAGVAEAKQCLIDEFDKWIGSPLGTFTLAQPEVSGPARVQVALSTSDNQVTMRGPERSYRSVT